MMRPVRRNARGSAVGQSHWKARLVDSEVELVIALVEDGVPYSKIATKMEVSKSCVQHIASGRCRR